MFKGKEKDSYLDELMQIYSDVIKKIDNGNRTTDKGNYFEEYGILSKIDNAYKNNKSIAQEAVMESIEPFRFSVVSFNWLFLACMDKNPSTIMIQQLVKYKFQTRVSLTLNVENRYGNLLSTTTTTTDTHFPLGIYLKTRVDRNANIDDDLVVYLINLNKKDIGKLYISLRGIAMSYPPNFFSPGNPVREKFISILYGLLLCLPPFTAYNKLDSMSYEISLLVRSFTEKFEKVNFDPNYIILGKPISQLYQERVGNRFSNDMDNYMDHYFTSGVKYDSIFDLIDYRGHQLILEQVRALYARQTDQSQMTRDGLAPVAYYRKKAGDRASLLIMLAIVECQKKPLPSLLQYLNTELEKKTLTLNSLQSYLNSTKPDPTQTWEELDVSLFYVKYCRESGMGYDTEVAALLHEYRESYHYKTKSILEVFKIKFKEFLINEPGKFEKFSATLMKYNVSKQIDHEVATKILGELEKQKSLDAKTAIRILVTTATGHPLFSNTSDQFKTLLKEFNGQMVQKAFPATSTSNSNTGPNAASPSILVGNSLVANSNRSSIKGEDQDDLITFDNDIVDDNKLPTNESTK